MGKQASLQDLPLRPRKDGEEIWRWLYGSLRSAILEGRLRPGARLPSTRALSRQYGISRGSVLAAFAHLEAEGYLTGETGSGRFVSRNLPGELLHARRTEIALAADLPPSLLSHRGQRLQSLQRPLPATRTVGRAFRLHEPALDQFPTETWARVAARVVRRMPRTMLGLGDPQGLPALRRAIATYLGAARGVRCEASQIIVTQGAQQALHLCGQLLLDPDDVAWIEDPGYPGARAALQAAGARILPIPVDAQGLRLPAAEQPPPRLIYTTPANQFPMGMPLSLERRLALLEFAHRHRAWVIDDDYDSEFRYEGRPMAALQGLDAHGCVIYLGTFAKMLFPALRLGFVVMPEALVEAFAAARGILDRHPPLLNQAILAEFMLEGHLGPHLRRMREVYAARQQELIAAARRDLAGLAEVQPLPAGMRALAWLPAGVNDADAAAAAREAGLELAPVSQFTLEHRQPDALLLGFAAVPEDELRRGVRTLAEVLGKKRC